MTQPTKPMSNKQKLIEQGHTFSNDFCQPCDAAYRSYGCMMVDFEDKHKPMSVDEILLDLYDSGRTDHKNNMYTNSSSNQAKAQLIELVESLPVEEESWVDDFGMASTEPLYRPLRAIDFRNALIKAIRGEAK